jgi:hypothetical protein
VDVFSCTVLAAEPVPKLFKIQDDESVFFQLSSRPPEFVVYIYVLCPYKQTDREKDSLIPNLLAPLKVKDETDILYVNTKMEGITEKHKLMI